MYSRKGKCGLERFISFFPRLGLVAKFLTKSKLLTICNLFASSPLPASSKGEELEHRINNESA
jgi:hypothetical protein